MVHPVTNTDPGSQPARGIDEIEIWKPDHLMTGAADADREYTMQGQATVKSVIRKCLNIPVSTNYPEGTYRV